MTDSEMLDILGSNDSLKIDNDLVFLKDDLKYWKKTVLKYVKGLSNSSSLRGYVEMNKISHKCSMCHSVHTKCSQRKIFPDMAQISEVRRHSLDLRKIA